MNSCADKPNTQLRVYIIYTSIIINQKYVNNNYLITYEKTTKLINYYEKNKIQRCKLFTDFN